MKTSSNKILLFIVLGVILIGVIALIVYFVSANDKYTHQRNKYNTNPPNNVMKLSTVFNNLKQTGPRNKYNANPSNNVMKLSTVFNNLKQTDPGLVKENYKYLKFLGTGYDLSKQNFNDIKNIGKPVIIIPQIYDEEITNKTYIIDGDGTGSLDDQSGTSTSIKDFRESLVYGGSLEADASGFGASCKIDGSLKIGKDISGVKSVTTIYKKSQFDSGNFSISTNSYPQYVNPEFVKDLTFLLSVDRPRLVSASFPSQLDWSLYRSFLNKYGSHIITQVNFGAYFEIRYSCADETNNTVSDLDASGCISGNAKGESYTVAGEVCNQTQMNEKDKRRSMNIVRTVVCKGGDDATRAELITINPGMLKANEDVTSWILDFGTKEHTLKFYKNYYYMDGIPITSDKGGRNGNKLTYIITDNLGVMKYSFDFDNINKITSGYQELAGLQNNLKNTPITPTFEIKNYYENLRTQFFQTAKTRPGFTNFVFKPIWDILGSVAGEGVDTDRLERVSANLQECFNTTASNNSVNFTSGMNLKFKNLYYNRCIGEGQDGNLYLKNCKDVQKGFLTGDEKLKYGSDNTKCLTHLGSYGSNIYLSQCDDQNISQRWGTTGDLRLKPKSLGDRFCIDADQSSGRIVLNDCYDIDSQRFDFIRNIIDGGPSPPASGYLKNWTFGDDTVLSLDSSFNFYLGNTKLVYGRNVNWLSDSQLDIPNNYLNLNLKSGKIQFTGDLVKSADFTDGSKFNDVNYTISLDNK